MDSGIDVLRSELFGVVGKELNRVITPDGQKGIERIVGRIFSTPLDDLVEGRHLGEMEMIGKNAGSKASITQR